jgi:hypothetical protein
MAGLKYSTALHTAYTVHYTLAEHSIESDLPFRLPFFF